MEESNMAYVSSLCNKTTSRMFGNYKLHNRNNFGSF